MRLIAERAAGAGFHVELPRLPGHGTRIEDMVPTRWADWRGEAEAAAARLAERTDGIVVAGLSMGGTLALSLSLDRPVRGLVLVNPATSPRSPEIRALVAEALDDGIEIYPGVPPETGEVGYVGTPLAAVLSFFDDGLAPIGDRLHEVTCPVLLFTARGDEVVPPDDSTALAAAVVDVDHRWLDHDEHSATTGTDAEHIASAAVSFALRVTGTVAS